MTGGGAGDIGASYVFSCSLSDATLGMATEMC